MFIDLSNTNVQTSAVDIPITNVDISGNYVDSYHPSHVKVSYIPGDPKPDGMTWSDIRVLRANVVKGTMTISLSDFNTPRLFTGFLIDGYDRLYQGDSGGGVFSDDNTMIGTIQYGFGKNDRHGLTGIAPTI